MESVSTLSVLLRNVSPQNGGQMIHIGVHTNALQYTQVCAVAEVGNRRLPTAVGRVRDRSKTSVGFVVDRAALGQVSSEYFGVPCH
jgi:hypothetical protein